MAHRSQVDDLGFPAANRLDALPDDWIVVNCAECECLAIVAPLPVPKGSRVKAFGGREKGRPYCVECFFFSGERPDERRRSSDYRRSGGQFDKLSKEFFQ